MNSIGYAANKWGYVVQICDDGQVVEEYHAGNHQRDSQLVVSPDSPNAELPPMLHQFARQTALKMAEELYIPKKDVAYDSDLHSEINELAGQPNTVRAVVELPRCWKRLVDTVFIDDEGEPMHAVLPNGKSIQVTSEHYTKGNDDPDPHYDDCRTVVAVRDGVTFLIDLCSGQGNYYAGITLSTEKELIYEGEPIESFSSPIELKGENGKTYLIEIKWEGTDPYEKR